MNVQILHGTALAEQKPVKQPKRAKTNLTLTARVRVPLFNEVDKIARAKGVTQSDIVRSAVIEFVRKLREAEGVDGNPLPLVDSSSAPAVAQPRLADAYRSDRSDVRLTKAVTQRQTDRLRAGLAGEKMLDKAPSR